MGEEEREDLRDTLKLPVRLRRTLSFVIPAEAGIQFWGLPSTPSWIAGLGGTPKPSAKGKGATDHAPPAPLHTPDGWHGQSETCP